MLVYVYDGTFQGLLTAVYEAYYSGKHPERIESGVNLQCSLVDSYLYIITDTGKANRVYCSIHDRISEASLEHVYNCFLSEGSDVGTLIYEYLKFGWRVGGKVDEYLADDRVLRVHEISQRVGHEKHKMLGFVRFKLLEGNIYYAPVRPDNNIIELLAPHFAERLSHQNWIIHDIRRDIAVFYNKSNWLITDFTLDKLPSLARDEEACQKLWKEFFNTIAITGRLNPKLQRQFMPRRYWSCLTEKL